MATIFEIPTFWKLYKNVRFARNLSNFWPPDPSTQKSHCIFRRNFSKHGRIRKIYVKPCKGLTIIFCYCDWVSRFLWRLCSHQHILQFWVKYFSHTSLKYHPEKSNMILILQCQLVGNLANSQNLQTNLARINAFLLILWYWGFNIQSS